MANNIDVTPGSGATIAVDDVAGVGYQVVKLADGTEDSTTRIVAGGGVESAALRVTIASDSTGVLSVDDNGSTISVDDGGGNISIDDGGNVISVDDGAGSLTVDNAALSVTGGGVEASALRVTLASDSTGVLSVDDNGSSLTVDNAALSVTGGGVEASALRVTLATDSTGVLSVDDGGNVLSVDDAGGSITVDDGGTSLTVDGSVTVVGPTAHDALASGDPVRIGARAETSPKGQTLVGDGDCTDIIADADGIPIVKLGTSGADAISESVSNTDGASTAFTNFSAVASTYNHITAISAFRTDAGTTMAYIDFRDGTAGSVLWRVPLPPAGGVVITLAGQPIFKTSANTALAYDVSSALTTVYISVSGYQSKV